MIRTLTIAIIVIAVIAMMTAGQVYAKKHHHLTDTQKEDSSASDVYGRPCNFGPDYDQCKVQFEQSKEKTCHFGPNHDECFKEAWDNDSKLLVV
jgi:hypothetical protein